MCFFRLFVVLFVLCAFIICLGEEKMLGHEKKKSEFYSLLYCRIVSMDPLYGETDCDMIVQNQIFEPLFEISPETLSIRPVLVKSYSYSEDLLKYTLKLKEGILFHDGTPLDADDVLFTFERVAKERPEKMGFLKTPLLNLKDGSVSGIKKIDQYTLEFSLEGPSAVFLNWLADPFFSILPKSQKEAIKSGHFKTHPIGSGAFKFSTYSNNDGLELLAFDRYHSGLPDISKIHFPFLSEIEAKKRFLKGELDQLFPYRFTQEELKEGHSHQEVPYRVFYTIKINPTFYPHPNNPFLSLEGRRAFRQALNIGDIHKKVTNPMLERGGGLIPFGLAGYSPLETMTLSSEEMSAGLKKFKNIPLVIGCSSGVDSVRPLVKALKENLLKNGLSVSFVIEEVKSVFEGTKNGKYLASLTSGFARYPDSLSILEQVNKFGYSSDEYAKILNSARHQADRIKRAKIYKEGDEFLYKDVAVIPLFHGGGQKGLFSKRWVIPKLDFIGELFIKYRDIKAKK